MTVKSNRAAISAALESGTKESLKEIAGEVKRQVADRLKEGFTSGDFVTGDLAQSVQVSEVEGVRGDWSVTVFSDDPVALFWEVGHNNIFTKRFEKVEVWRPIVFNFSNKALDIMATTIKQKVNNITE